MYRLILALLLIIGCGEKPRFESHFEFPIVTHYPQQGGAKADKNRKSPPGWGNFSNVTTDHTAPTRDRVIRSIQRWERSGDCPVDIYNHIDSLKSNVPRLQVINNVIIGKSLWTFFVSPNWKKDQSDYILVVSGRTGSSSNNSTAYGGGGPLKLPEQVAKAGIMGYPFILAFVNQGGRESQGNHPDVLKSVGEGITFAKQNFHIDDQRIVFAGKSRGAASALIWGANPSNLNYKTAAIFAHASPTNYGTICYQPNGTFPILGSLVAAELSPNHKPNWIPSEEHNRQMHILRDCMAGSQKPDTMKTRSQIALVDQYKDIYLALGWSTHDPMVGPQEGFDFVQALDNANVPYFSEFTLSGTHSNSQGVRNAFGKFMRNQVGISTEELPTGRAWNQMIQKKDKHQYKVLEDGSPVWTVFPQITTANRDNAIYVGAPDGSQVYILAKKVGGDVTWLEEDTKVEWDYVRVDLPPPPEPGRYKWTIVVGNVEIPDEAISTRDSKGKPLPAETRVLEKERYIDELFDRSENARTFGHAWEWPF
ncbi:MAG: hypothetical protein HN521_17620 [Candidatus Latescibacteria bacterium]|jgi:hypothetical protein|nr:hypothetical protein [Candidatus Latescibacterota bacterium]